MSDEKPILDTYYHVALAQPLPWSKQHLTYSSDRSLASGTVVEAPLGNKKVLGVVVEPTTPPKDLLASIKPVDPLEFRLSDGTNSFYQWIEQYYPSAGYGHLSKFLPSFVDRKLLIENNDDEAPAKKGAANLSIELNKDQLNAYKTIEENQSTPIVLHGVTGSGKTAIYARKAIDCLEENKHVLLIVPEISLISQLSKSIQKLIPEADIFTYHSSQTLKESKRTWNRAVSGSPATIFVGTRSALFLPFASLGTVVVDEAHEYSLKEDHESSHYHGLIAAAALAKSHSGQFIIGSATPPIPETELMLKKGAHLVCMHSIAKQDHDFQTEINIIDIDKERGRRRTSGQITPPLQEAIKDSLSKDEQSLLFLNKLGSAHIVECGDCGWQAVCPNCDANLVYHHDTHSYRCNICGYTKKTASSCEECGGQLKTKSLAIKSVESEIKKLFPLARVARFDSSNKKKDSIGELYEQVRRGEYDVIIGTQLMAKGFDFPKLSTVGVINADALLNLPDINAEERLFSQLLQVSGRVGRGHRNGSVYVQTRQADNHIFNLVKTNDWHRVFESELVKRKKHGYPPNTFIAKITVKGSNELIAKNRAHQVADAIGNDVVASPPFPAFHYKRNKNFYWQIICRSKQRSDLLNMSGLRNKYTDVDFDPVTLL